MNQYLWSSLVAVAFLTSNLGVASAEALQSRTGDEELTDPLSAVELLSEAHSVSGVTSPEALNTFEPGTTVRTVGHSASQARLENASSKFSAGVPSSGLETSKVATVAAIREDETIPSEPAPVAPFYPNEPNTVVEEAPQLPAIPQPQAAPIAPAEPQFEVASIQDGVASWYGPGLNGNRSASGEVFNQNSLTAAHRSLPFGTQVRVTNLRNGRSVIVRINDRGPFSRSRIIDLSRAAANAIDMVNAGVAQVRLEILR